MLSSSPRKCVYAHASLLRLSKKNRALARSCLGYENLQQNSNGKNLPNPVAWRHLLANYFHILNGNISHDITHVNEMPMGEEPLSDPHSFESQSSTSPIRTAVGPGVVSIVEEPLRSLRYVKKS